MSKDTQGFPKCLSDLCVVKRNDWMFDVCLQRGTYLFATKTELAADKFDLAHQVFIHLPCHDHDDDDTFSAAGIVSKHKE